MTTKKGKGKAKRMQIFPPYEPRATKDDNEKQQQNKGMGARIRF
jgi:hypothetical protein